MNSNESYLKWFNKTDIQTDSHSPKIFDAGFEAGQESLRKAVEKHVEWLKKNYVSESCEEEHFPEKDCISCQAGLEGLDLMKGLKS
ncbi:MAG TPA: hypothetical protein VMW39_06875 [bacterium]|nr:hypothetical protein [bacterium]